MNGEKDEKWIEKERRKKEKKSDKKAICPTLNHRLLNKSFCIMTGIINYYSFSVKYSREDWRGKLKDCNKRETEKNEKRGKMIEERESENLVNR